MRIYESESIRNIAIIGHGTSGKTSLTSAMLFNSGAINRLARVEDGNTVTDYEEEEIERKISISSALAHCEWNKKKINILDTPGYRPFLTDTSWWWAPRMPCWLSGTRSGVWRYRAKR